MSLDESTILIVDDNPTIRAILEKCLEDEAYTVLCAENCTEADEVLEKEEVDLILLDVNLPDRTGYEFLEAARKVKKTEDVPVIFLTGVQDITDKVRAFELGAADFISKPFQITDVLLRVRTHLQLSMQKHKRALAEQESKLKQIKEAQNAMLVEKENCPEAKFDVYCSFLSEAGGDFYDVFEVSPGCFVYFVADISGHDIKTSYITPIVKTLLRECIKDTSDLKASIQRLNLALKENLPESKFVTASLIFLDRNECALHYLNMGHLPALFVPDDLQDKVVYLEAIGDVLGVFDEIKIGEVKVPVNRGDRFVLFTDGLIEDAAQRIPFTEGLKHLEGFTEKIRTHGDKTLAESILQETDGFRSGDQQDDIVILTVEV